MRIAMLARRFDPFGGGTERDLMVTARMLARAGHRITVYADEVRAHSTEFEVRRVGVSRLSRAIAIIRFAYAAPAIARAAGADLVLSFARTIGADILRSGGGAHVSYLRAARRWRSPLGASAMRLAPYHRAQMMVERRGFRSPSLRRVIAVSNLVRDDLSREFDLPSGLAVTLYNGVDLERFKPAANREPMVETRREYGISESAEVVAFAGNGFARKGLATLLDASASLARKPYLIVVGDDRARSWYQRRAMILEIEGRTIFAGRQPDVERFFQAADVFAFPSLFEPFGNVALEAMACGIPALTSAACGVAELMPPELSATVAAAPDNAEGVARLLDMMLANSDRLGQVARETAEQHSWARHERDLLAIIDSLADR